ncbi:MAG: T9SS type A sorting domain-containing protein [Candidatus Marinimicrobia bacterium]|nr:T9SS type A sorting domain-containing protein [Candidatus Neomarinimicrobiota bacterium]
MKANMISTIITLVILLPKALMGYGFGAHLDHLESIIALNDQYLELYEDPRYQPYFLYGCMAADLQYTNKFKTGLLDLYQKVREITVLDIIHPLGLTYEISVDQIPDSEYPFGFNNHDSKYGLKFAEYMLQACEPIDPPGPNPGSDGTTEEHGARCAKLAFALGYYCHLATDIACHDFLVPKIVAESNLGDLELITYDDDAPFVDHPAIQVEGVIELLTDHHFTDANRVSDAVFQDDSFNPYPNYFWVAAGNAPGWGYQLEPCQGIVIFDGPNTETMFYEGINPVLYFWREVMQDWINNNPWDLPTEYTTGPPISLIGLAQTATIFRFVNRFYPAIAGHEPINEVLGEWIGNHIWWPDGVDVGLALAEFLYMFFAFDFRSWLLEGWIYPRATTNVNENIVNEVLSLVSLMISDMAEADRIVTELPNRVNVDEYNKLKSSPLFTNTASVIASYDDYYKDLGTQIYRWIGPGGYWYEDWTPWNEASMRWGVQSSLNHYLPDYYEVNSNIAVFDCYFTLNGERVEGPIGFVQIGVDNLGAVVELYNLYDVAPVNVTIKIKTDHISGNYSDDELVVEASDIVDQDPFDYDDIQRKEISVTFGSTELEGIDISQINGLYLELQAGTNPFFSSLWDLYETIPEVQSYSNYDIYSTYDHWPQSLRILPSMSGHITANTTWEDDILITGDVIIDGGITLTILSGVTLNFSEGTTLTVNGTLDIQGSESQPVTLTSNEQWEGIELKSGCNLNMQHTEIRHANKAVKTSFVEGIVCDIENCEFQYNLKDIHLFYFEGNVNISNNYFHDSLGDILLIQSLVLTEETNFTYNTIADNYGGLTVLLSNTFNFTRNLFMAIPMRAIRSYLSFSALSDPIQFYEDTGIDLTYLNADSLLFYFDPYRDITTMNIISNTISNNNAGISCGISVVEQENQVDIRNNIIVGNNLLGEYQNLGIYVGDNAYTETIIEYNDVYDNVAGNYGGTVSDQTGLNGNISEDPLFDENYNLTWANFPVEDETKSPCIDSGDPDSPLDPDLTRADMGAFYFDYPPSTPQDLVLTGEVGDYPMLTWELNPEPDISHYEVWRYYIDINTDGILIEETMYNYYEDTDFIISYVEEDEDGKKLIKVEYHEPDGYNMRVYYRVMAVDLVENISDYSNGVHTYQLIPGSPWKVSSPDNTLFVLPEEYALHANYPNPFNAVTTIRYDLPEDSFVVLKIYDLLGREIRTLINFKQAAGFKTILWDGKDNHGNKVPSGMYIYRFSAKSLESDKQFHKTMKMVLLR